MISIFLIFLIPGNNESGRSTDETHKMGTMKPNLKRNIEATPKLQIPLLNGSNK